MNKMEKKIRLFIFGYYEYEPNKYKVLCTKHGIQEGYMHGWRNNVDCMKCLEDTMTEWKKGRKDG